MHYLLLAVMFYTIVRYSVEVWTELLFARKEREEYYGNGKIILDVEKRVGAMLLRLDAIEREMHM